MYVIAEELIQLRAFAIMLHPQWYNIESHETANEELTTDMKRLAHAVQLSRYSQMAHSM
jgi:hypothetical protein